MRFGNYVVLRAFEVALGAVVVALLLVAINGGWLSTGAQRFSDWYASQVDGMLDITVVSTAVTLPEVHREDLPIPQQTAPASSAPPASAHAN